MESQPNIRRTLKRTFVGKSGAFYVINPVDITRYAKYDSVDTYNDHTGFIDFVNAIDALADYDRDVVIGPGPRVID